MSKIPKKTLIYYESRIKKALSFQAQDSSFTPSTTMLKSPNKQLINTTYHKLIKALKFQLYNKFSYTPPNLQFTGKNKNSSNLLILVP